MKPLDPSRLIQLSNAIRAAEIAVDGGNQEIKRAEDTVAHWRSITGQRERTLAELRHKLFDEASGRGS